MVDGNKGINKMNIARDQVLAAQVALRQARDAVMAAESAANKAAAALAAIGVQTDLVAAFGEVLSELGATQRAFLLRR